MNTFEYMSCDEDVLQALLEEPIWLNKIHRKIGKNKRYLSKQLDYLKRQGLVRSWKEKKKTLYELTAKGKDACTYYKIRREAGYTGIQWASKLFEKGFRIRFLSDLTDLERHKSFMFAWNPETREVKLAQIFGVKEFPEGRYVAQYVDRDKAPNKPIRDANLHGYVKQNVEDFEDESQISKALKEFYDEKTFNSFIALITPPKTIRFGFPIEVGNFDTMVFLGFGYQKHFPFVPKLSIGAGAFSVSKAIAFQLYYEVNLCALQKMASLYAKSRIDPSISEDMIWSWDKEAFKRKYLITCRHLIHPDLKCRKKEIKCPYIDITTKRLNIKDCDITKKELEQLRIEKES